MKKAPPDPAQWRHRADKPHPQRERADLALAIFLSEERAECVGVKAQDFRQIRSRGECTSETRESYWYLNALLDFANKSLSRSCFSLSMPKESRIVG
jgi:hypothetical protein